MPWNLSQEMPYGVTGELFPWAIGTDYGVTGPPIHHESSPRNRYCRDDGVYVFGQGYVNDHGYGNDHDAENADCRHRDCENDANHAPGVDHNHRNGIDPSSLVVASNSKIHLRYHHLHHQTGAADCID